MTQSGSLEAVKRQDEDEDIAESEAFFGLDAGVASTVLALAAARCIPVSSCNGMPGHQELHPLVAFFCRPTRLPDLLAVADEAQCGLENASMGALVVYAHDVTRMIEFARKLIEHRHSLSKITATRSVSQAKREDAAQMALPFC